MSDIIIAFPNPSDSKVLRSILIKNGYSIVGVVASGAQAINLSDDIDYGIVVCAYQLNDMQYMEIKENMNETCELLLVCSPGKLDENPDEDINFLPMPFKVIELVKKVSEISDKLYYERKRKKKQEERGSKNFMAIQKAKELLIKYKNMTEPEAHKYLQISSMKNGETIINTAKKICLLYGGKE
ncbi:ANTAR domain protein [Lachnoanaerobaculum sp. MSX33]|uniref:ANTAR domain-containing response regulator n=1 Tax=Lachnoanaerobaculum sp. MSX33 TaxID=936596 RepID=UPI0003DF8417|nr:ANTAR domain-containing protein [Lachnoanaerobaculum sp. MSX33]ETO95119.1 ANTAR domain protein [Lachnoanaerobaculum sp. MSX33]